MGAYKRGEGEIVSQFEVPGLYGFYARALAPAFNLRRRIND